MQKPNFSKPKSERLSLTLMALYSYGQGMKWPSILLLSIFCIGKAHAGWLWLDHYYLITTTSGEEYTTKGEPWEKNEFTVFTQWPDKAEMRLKTALIASVKDTGPLSPEDLQAKEEKELATKESNESKKWLELKKRVEELFPISEKTHYPHLVPATLEQARGLGASDQHIWEVLEETPNGDLFKSAKKNGYILDTVADVVLTLESSPNQPTDDPMQSFRKKKDIFDEIAEESYRKKSSH